MPNENTMLSSDLDEKTYLAQRSTDVTNALLDWRTDSTYASYISNGQFNLSQFLYTKGYLTFQTLTSGPYDFDKDRQAVTAFMAQYPDYQTAILQPNCPWGDLRGYKVDNKAYPTISFSNILLNHANWNRNNLQSREPGIIEPAFANSFLSDIQVDGMELISPRITNSSLDRLHYRDLNDAYGQTLVNTRLSKNNGNPLLASRNSFVGITFINCDIEDFAFNFELSDTYFDADTYLASGTSFVKTILTNVIMVATSTPGTSVSFEGSYGTISFTDMSKSIPYAAQLPNANFASSQLIIMGSLKGVDFTNANFIGATVIGTGGMTYTGNAIPPYFISLGMDPSIANSIITTAPSLEHEKVQDNAASSSDLDEYSYLAQRSTDVTNALLNWRTDPTYASYISNGQFSLSQFLYTKGYLTFQTLTSGPYDFDQDRQAVAAFMAKYPNYQTAMQQPNCPRGDLRGYNLDNKAYPTISFSDILLTHANWNKNDLIGPGILKPAFTNTVMSDIQVDGMYLRSPSITNSILDGFQYNTLTDVNGQSLVGIRLSNNHLNPLLRCISTMVGLRFTQCNIENFRFKFQLSSAYFDATTFLGAGTSFAEVALTDVVMVATSASSAPVSFKGARGTIAFTGMSTSTPSAAQLPNANFASSRLIIMSSLAGVDFTNANFIGATVTGTGGMTYTGSAIPPYFISLGMAPAIANSIITVAPSLEQDKAVSAAKATEKEESKATTQAPTVTDKQTSLFSKNAKGKQEVVSSQGETKDTKGKQDDNAHKDNADKGKDDRPGPGPGQSL